MTYAEALARVDQKPALRALHGGADRLRRAAGEVSGLASDLELISEAGPRTGDGGRAQTRIQLAQSFSTAGLGAAREAAAEAHADAFTAEGAAFRMLRRIEASSAWLMAYGAQRALSVAREESALARELMAQSARARALGEATLADVADTEAYAAEAQLAVLAAEGDWMQARLQLSAAVASRSELLEAAGEPPALLPPSAAEARALLARLERTPAAAAAERRWRAAHARARELDAQHAAALRVGVALDHGDPGTWTPLAIFGVNLPWSGRVARERAGLQADMQLLEAERTQATIDAGLQIERALHELEHSGQILQQLDEQLLPAIERGVSARTRLFAAGEITAQELILTRRNLLAQRLRRERARVQRLSALASVYELRVASEGNVHAQ